MLKPREEVIRNIRRGVFYDIELCHEWYPCQHFVNGECHHAECKPPVLNEIRQPVPQKQIEQLTARMNWLEKRLAHKEDTERVNKPDWK